MIGAEHPQEIPWQYMQLSCTVHAAIAPLHAGKRIPCKEYHQCHLIPCHARSVLFNFLGRDFFNALSAKDQETFTEMLFKWLGGIMLGVPVFVLRWVVAGHE